MMVTSWPGGEIGGGQVVRWWSGGDQVVIGW